MTVQLEIDLIIVKTIADTIPLKLAIESEMNPLGWIYTLTKRVILMPKYRGKTKLI